MTGIIFRDFGEIAPYVKAHWKELPKTSAYGKEFVCFYYRDDSGSYNTDMEGLLIDEAGNFFWTYCSGCSCNGGGDVEPVDLDKSRKFFSIVPDSLKLFDESIISYLKENGFESHGFVDY